ncbi:unnamed protein product [Leptosia nina]|uniref:Uncharacterized protein n=1 Tax=Leptosia nina TaxID=320188 RepID=A0AAV1J9A1_9NEOP
MIILARKEIESCHQQQRTRGRCTIKPLRLLWEIPCCRLVLRYLEEAVNCLEDAVGQWLDGNWYRTVAVPAALGLRGCELVAELAVWYRHGRASRARTDTTLHSARSVCSRATAPQAARLPLSLNNPPAPAGRRRPYPIYFGHT